MLHILARRGVVSSAVALGHVLLVRLFGLLMSCTTCLRRGLLSESFRMLLTFLWRQDQYDASAVTLSIGSSRVTSYQTGMHHPRYVFANLQKDASSSLARGAAALPS